MPDSAVFNDYIENYGSFSFERTETVSGDVITFCSQPLFSEPIYNENPEKALYIGGFMATPHKGCASETQLDFSSEYIKTAPAQIFV